jgi:hypothetical protein
MSRFHFSLLLALTLSIPGCGSKTASTPIHSGGAASGTGDSSATATSDDVLSSAIHQLRPENFDINAARDKPVSLLNSWRFKQAEAKLLTDQPVTVSAPTGWIKSDDETRLAQAKFDGYDASHIRDALFHRAISGYLSDRGRNELQRIGIIVDFVCRNVSLWKDDEIELPLLPYMTMQVGRGNAEDRAWVIAEILRQLRIDSVILRAKSDVKGTSEKWLLGVIVEGQIPLYDVRLGLPLWTPDAGENDTAATLSQIVSHPEWLEQMSVNEPYRLTHQDLTDLDVFVISEANFWCRRMYNLEQALPTSDVCVIYDPVSDEGDRSGLLQRVAKAGDWSNENLKLWPYPRLQQAELMRPNPEREKEWQQLTVPFSVPIPVKVDQEGKQTIGIPERKLQRCRTDHLLGKFADATTRYLRIRHLEVEPFPPEIERINRMASEDALFWTTLCKYELGEYATAVDLLLDYQRKYDRKGKWFFSARSLLAQCYARLDRLPDAIATLEKSSSDDPYRAANAVRLKRWSATKAK